MGPRRFSIASIIFPCSTTIKSVSHVSESWQWSSRRRLLPIRVLQRRFVVPLAPVKGGFNILGRFWEESDVFQVYESWLPIFWKWRSVHRFYEETGEFLTPNSTPTNSCRCTVEASFLLWCSSITTCRCSEFCFIAEKMRPQRSESWQMFNPRSGTYCRLIRRLVFGSRNRTVASRSSLARKQLGIHILLLPV